MSNPTRKHLLDLVAKVGEEFPDRRLGQLLLGLAYKARGATPDAIYDAEDEEMINAALEQLEYLRIHRHSKSPLTASSNTQSPPAVQPV